MVISLAALLLLSGCGLESFVVLSEPKAVLTAPPYTFQFRKLSTNGDTFDEPFFKGFELYYKIYGPLESIDNEANTLDELTTKKGFKRMNGKPPYTEAISKPLIPIALDLRSEEFIITIDFTDFTDVYSSTDYPKIYSESGISTPISITEVRRNVRYTLAGRSDEFKRFSNEPVYAEFEASDTDLSSAAWSEISDSTPGGPVQIVLFVLSYGYDPNSTTNPAQYSRPVWLGSLVNIYFPYP